MVLLVFALASGVTADIITRGAVRTAVQRGIKKVTIAFLATTEKHGKKGSLHRWFASFFLILLTWEPEKGGGGGGGGGGGKKSSKGPRWEPAKPVATAPPTAPPAGSPSYTNQTQTYEEPDQTQGSTSIMAEVNGITSYLQALDECSEAPEGMMAQASARAAAAAAAAESDHDNGAAAELADAWNAVVDALSAAGESSQSAASQAHTEYDGVVEQLSGMNAPAAQAYLGDQ